eukprot:7583183-Pyramimonas_sp.AAC.1
MAVQCSSTHVDRRSVLNACGVILPLLRLFSLLVPMVSGGWAAYQTCVFIGFSRPRRKADSRSPSNALLASSPSFACESFCAPVAAARRAGVDACVAPEGAPRAALRASS